MSKYFRYDNIFSENDKEKIREDYVINKLSLRDICNKYNIKSKSFAEKVLKPVIRSISEANKIAHKQKPENFKHTDKTKQKLREKRLKYMKENPPINEKMIEVLMSSMGRKPNSKQIKQVMAQMNRVNK